MSLDPHASIPSVRARRTRIVIAEENAMEVVVICGVLDDGKCNNSFAYRFFGQRSKGDKVL